MSKVSLDRLFRTKMTNDDGSPTHEFIRAFQPVQIMSEFLLFGTVDPTLLKGVIGRQGALYLRVASPFGVYQKTGTADTAWTKQT